MKLYYVEIKSKVSGHCWHHYFIDGERPYSARDGHLRTGLAAAKDLQVKLSPFSNVSEPVLVEADLNATQIHEATYDQAGFISPEKIHKELP